MRKPRRKASFLSFKASFLREASHNSFVFQLQSFISEGSLAEKLRFWASKHHFWRKSRRKGHLRLAWIPNELRTKALESQIIWQPNHLKLNSIDNQRTWISNQLTTKIIGITHQLTTKPLESQIRRQPNHLTLNSLESDINWFSNQLNSTRPLPIGSLSLETSATAPCGRYVFYQHMNPYVMFDYLDHFLRSGFAHAQTIAWLLLSKLPRRNSLKPSEPCLRNLHQHAPEPSGICLRNLHRTRRNSPELPEPSGTFQNLPELACGTYTSTDRNLPELSTTCLRNL